MHLTVIRSNLRYSVVHVLDNWRAFENWRGIVRLERGESHVPKWYGFRNNILYHSIQVSVPLRVEIVYVGRNAVGCQY